MVAQVTDSSTVPGLVSVIMPFLNVRESFFLEAVESIEEQSYENWELILIDDGSAAHCTEVARRLVARHPDKIHYLEHAAHANLGISASRNLGLTCAKGEYVAFLDADDVWDEGQLEEQVALLCQHAEAALLYGNTTYWHSWNDSSHYAGNDIRYKMGLRTSQVYQPPNISKLILQRRAISPCMTSVMLRRQTFLDGIEFEEEFREHYEDQVFLAKIFTRYPVYVSDRCWGKYRQHAESVTGDGDDSDHAKAWRLRYLHWLSRYLQDNKLKGTSVWYALRLELWMLQNRRVEKLTERIRLWRRRFRKVFGAAHVQ